MSSSNLTRNTALALSLMKQKVLPALHQVPLVAKYLFFLLFLLNYGGWPLAWHLRMFSPLFEGLFRLNVVKMRHLLSSKQTRKTALQACYESGMEIGEHPFRKVWTRSLRVRLDQSDFNLHMSNSSYAMVLDAARLRLALRVFPNIFRCGGWVPLSATHYHFVREIPILSKYEVRASIGSFDEKWLWVVSRFVNPAPPTSKKTLRATDKSSATSGSEPTVVPTLTVPSTPLIETPRNAHDASPPSSDAVAQALLAREAAKTTDPDGALLYTVTVEQFCFKQGRMTVPPAIVLAANGFHAGPGAGVPLAQTGKPAPPPHWHQARALMDLDSPKLRDLARFYAGGWREVPAGQRWWEDAFAGCEEERRARLVPFVGANDLKGGPLGGLRGAMEGVRGLGTE